MAAPNIKDFATALITEAPNTQVAGTTFKIAPSNVGRMPTLPWDGVVHPENTLPTLETGEKVVVTAMDADTGVITVTRAQGGTSAKVIDKGWRLSNAIFASHVSGAYNRANHFGTQPASSISDLPSVLGAYLPLTGGALTGPLTVQVNAGTDTGVTFQNLASGKAESITMVSNGGSNPYMYMSGLTGTNGDYTQWKLLWRTGSVNSPGYTIYTNNNGGNGYGISPAVFWDYSQNMTVYGNIQPNGTRSVGTSSAYFQNLYGTKHWFNNTAALDGTTAGQMLVTGLFRIPQGAQTGYVMTSNSSGLAQWQPAQTITNATPTNIGIVRLAGDLGGTASLPTVVGAHFGFNGFFIDDPDHKTWQITMNTYGEFVSALYSTGLSDTGTLIALGIL